MNGQNNKSQVIVVGGGFGGLSVIDRLCRAPRVLEILLIDQNPHAVFLPALPDVISRRISPEHLAMDLDQYAKERGIRFICSRVKAIDLNARAVTLEDGRYFSADHLVIASGSKTDFYGRLDLQSVCLTLDTLDDALRLRDAAQDDRYDHFVIVGAGYTAAEIATHIRRVILRRGTSQKVSLLVRSDQPFRFLNERQQMYALDNFRRMGIILRLKTEARDIRDKEVVLSTGEIIHNACVIWAAGVTAASVSTSVSADLAAQARIKVDHYNRFAPRCYAVGDVSAFIDHGQPLRMAVQFAYFAGQNAAKNILRERAGQPLQPYRPFDMGFVLPMANGRSCGNILGVPVYGFIPTFFHYFMCVFKAYGWQRKWGILKDLFR